MQKLMTISALIALSGPVSGADPEFENERARNALEAYRMAIDEARDAYIAALGLAITEEGGLGNLDEANLISEEKEALERERDMGENDPLRVFERELENTRWVTVSGGRRGNWTRFRSGNRTVNTTGDEGVWMVTDERTVVMQVFRTRSVYVFKFDEDLSSASIFKFEEDTEYRVTVQRR